MLLCLSQNSNSNKGDSRNVGWIHSDMLITPRGVASLLDHLHNSLDEPNLALFKSLIITG